MAPNVYLEPGLPQPEIYGGPNTFKVRIPPTMNRNTYKMLPGELLLLLLGSIVANV